MNPPGFQCGPVARRQSSNSANTSWTGRPGQDAHELGQVARPSCDSACSKCTGPLEEHRSVLVKPELLGHGVAAPVNVPQRQITVGGISSKLRRNAWPAAALERQAVNALEPEGAFLRGSTAPAIRRRPDNAAGSSRHQCSSDITLGVCQAPLPCCSLPVAPGQSAAAGQAVDWGENGNASRGFRPVGLTGKSCSRGSRASCCAPVF